MKIQVFGAYPWSVGLGETRTLRSSSGRPNRGSRESVEQGNGIVPYVYTKQIHKTLYFFWDENLFKSLVPLVCDGIGQ